MAPLSTSFLLALGYLASNTLAATSELPPIPVDKTSPVQQRLGYLGTTGMTVGWNTYQQITTPTVHYGTDSGNLNLTASSQSSVTYASARTWSNTVQITNLIPATLYYYKIDSTNSSVDSFKTSRITGDTAPFTAAVVIDMGVMENHTTINRLNAMSAGYEFVLHPGDLGYADDWYLGVVKGIYSGSLLDGKNIFEGLIEQFYDNLASISKMKPYMVGPGNHEADCTEIPYTGILCSAGQKNFTGFINRFGTVMPRAPTVSNATLARRGITDAKSKTIAKRDVASLANPPFWYSFDYGMAHFVFIDTETDLGQGLKGAEESGGSAHLNNGPFGGVNQQIQFLTQDLASVDRSVTPWVIVNGHRPWYTTGTACTECQTAFEAIFQQYNVDLGVFGHVHNLQEHVPIYNGVIDPAGLNNPKAPWYIVSGAAGSIEGRASLKGVTLPNYTAWANDAVYGFSTLTFKDRNNLEVNFYSSDDGSVLRTSTLYKKH